MRKLSVFLLAVAMTLPVLCQESTPKYVSGSVTAVVRHHDDASQANQAVRYDVSVKVANTIYVVLYTPPNGSTIVEYRVGAGLPVLVGEKTLTFNDLTGGKHELPILRTMPATAEN